MTQTIEQLRWLGNYLADDAESKGVGQGSEGARYCFAGAKTIEQLQARVAELEAENATLHEQVDLQIPALAFKQLQEQLVAAQAEIKRLRDAAQDAVDKLRNTDNWLWEDLVQALSQPSDTSSLDAYVAEKVKEKLIEMNYSGTY